MGAGHQAVVDDEDDGDRRRHRGGRRIKSVAVAALASAAGDEIGKEKEELDEGDLEEGELAQ